MNMRILPFLGNGNKSRYLLTVLLFIGITICIYSICSILGTSMAQYILALRGNDTASLTVKVDSTESFSVEEFKQEVTNVVPEGVSNILYFSELQENQYVIGWDGYNDTMWFPRKRGRFFSEEEQEMGKHVAYGSDSIKGVATVEGTKFQVIGGGWIIPQSFTVAMAKEIKPYFTSMREEEVSFIILPYKAYANLLKPDVILVQTSNGSVKNLKRYQKALNEYPGISVYLPPKTAEDVLNHSQIIYGIYALLFSFMSLITIVQLLNKWIYSQRESFYVFRVCGMRSITCYLLIYLQVLGMMLVSTAVAVGLHYLSRPILSIFYADALPKAGTMAVLLAIIFVLVIGFTLDTARGVIWRTRRSVE